MVGHEARDQQFDNIESTVYNLMRLIGKKFSDPNVKNEVKYLAYKIKEGPNESILISVNEKGKEVTYTCEQVMSHVFKHIKDKVSQWHTFEVSQAIIAVPS